MCKRKATYIDTAINRNDYKMADAFWTLLKPLKREVRQLLAIRLDESLKEQDVPTKEITMAEAERFIQTLSVHGKMKVPVDEKGINALVDEKY